MESTEKNNKEKKNIVFLFGAGCEGNKQLEMPSGSEFKKDTINAIGASDLFEKLNVKNSEYKLDKRKFICHNATSVLYQTLIENKDFFDSIPEQYKETVNDYLAYKKKKIDLSEERKKEITNKFREFYNIEIYKKIVDEKVKSLSGLPEKFLECVCPYSYIDGLFNYLRIPNKYKYETAKVMKLYYSAFNSIFAKLGIQLHSNDIMENRKKLQDGLNDVELFKKLKGWGSDELYYRIIKKYKNELKDKFDINVITTNYTPFAEQIIELEEASIAYVHGKLIWFEDVETKEVKKVSEFKEDRIIFPFIFVQSGIKPVVSPVQIKEYAKAVKFLENAEYIIVLGYGINSDDEHIVNMLRECKLGDKKNIYLNYDKDKNVEIKENLEKLLGKESNLEIRNTEELETVLKEIMK